MRVASLGGFAFVCRFLFICSGFVFYYPNWGGDSAVCPLPSSGVSPLFRCPLCGFLFIFPSSGCFLLFLRCLVFCFASQLFLWLSFVAAPPVVSLSLSISISIAFFFLSLVWGVSVFAWLYGISLVVVLCFSYFFYFLSAFVSFCLPNCLPSIICLLRCGLLPCCRFLVFSPLWCPLSRRFGSSGYTSAFRIRFSLVPIFFGVRRCPIRCWLRLFFSFLFLIVYVSSGVSDSVCQRFLAYLFVLFYRPFCRCVWLSSFLLFHLVCSCFGASLSSVCFVHSFTVSLVVAWLALFIIVRWISWLSDSPVFSFFLRLCAIFSSSFPFLRGRSLSSSGGVL